MRKVILVLFCFISAIACSESKKEIFYGYDKVKWGTELEKVIEIYSIIEKPIDFEKGNYILSQNKPNEFINFRTFIFIGNKLFSVEVKLNENLNKETIKEILKELDKYGKKNIIDNSSYFYSDNKTEISIKNDKENINISYIDIIKRNELKKKTEEEKKQDKENRKNKIKESGF